MIVDPCRSLYVQTENGRNQIINNIKQCEHNNIIVTMFNVMYDR